MEKKCRLISKGAWIGVGIGVAYLFSKKEYRDSMCAEAKKIKDCTMSTLCLIRENREEIFSHIRETVQEVTSLAQDISEDIKQISESAIHLKESTDEIVQATKNVANDMKHLK